MVDIDNLLPHHTLNVDFLSRKEVVYRLRPCNHVITVTNIDDEFRCRPRLYALIQTVKRFEYGLN